MTMGVRVGSAMAAPHPAEISYPMQEKPNSQSKVLGAFTRQFFITSPGSPPAAAIRRSRSPALEFTTPTTCA